MSRYGSCREASTAIDATQLPTLSTVRRPRGPPPLWLSDCLLPPPSSLSLRDRAALDEPPCDSAACADLTLLITCYPTTQHKRYDRILARDRYPWYGKTSAPPAMERADREERRHFTGGEGENMERETENDYGWLPCTCPQHCSQQSHRDSAAEERFIIFGISLLPYNFLICSPSQPIRGSIRLPRSMIPT